MISNQEFEDLIQRYLSNYRNSQPTSARKILHALSKWRKTKTDWLAWWKQQKLDLRMEMQIFLFWLVRQDKFSINSYEEIHNQLTPAQASTKTIPVSLVESGGTPKFEGGVVNQEWTLFNYVFKKTDETGRWNITFVGTPSQNRPSVDLNLVLSAISFDIKRKQSNAKIGLEAHYFQASSSIQNEAVYVGMRATIHTLPYIEPEQVEKLIRLSKLPSSNGLSVQELLRVRHRAIIDSSNESKLITLWGMIELELGSDQKRESLFTEEEIKEIDSILKSSTIESSKQELIFKELPKFKKKTKTL